MILAASPSPLQPMRHTPLLALLPLAFLATACASGTGGASSSSTRDRVLITGADGTVVRQTSDVNVAMSFEAPMDRVWNAVVATYDDVGIQANTADRAAGRYGVVNFPVPNQLRSVSVGQLFSCGSNLTGPNVNQGRVRADVITTLTARSGGGTNAAMLVTGVLRKFDASSTDPITCQSTGRLESLMQKSIERKLSETK